MTRVLLTGASGFCGRHLARYLSAEGVDVYPMRAFSPSASPLSQLEALDVAALTPVIRQTRPDYVLHLAGVAATEHPALYYVINASYAAALLRALEAAGHGRVPVLLVGTAAEYGKISAGRLPVDEECPPAPYSDYGVSKLAQTLLGLAAAGRGRPIVVARPFNIIGPGMPGHLVLQAFSEQVGRIARGEIPPVLRVGNLDSARDFVDVDDVVRSYWKLVQTPAAYGQVVNVCSGAPVTIRTALEAMLALAGVDVDVQIDPARVKALDIPVHYGSRAKLDRLIGDTVTTPFTSSLERIVSAVLSP